MEGKIKWWNAKNGYGFIMGDDGTEAFLDVRNIVSKWGKAEISDDDRVIYSIIDAERGPIAVNVQVLAQSGDEDVLRTVFFKIEERKYNESEWKIEECKAWYEFNKATYLSKCLFSTGNDPLQDGWIKIHTDDRYIEFSYTKGGVEYANNFKVGARKFDVVTYPSSSIIKICNYASITVENNKDFNSIVMVLKYADYLLQIGEWEEKDALCNFKEIDVMEQDVLKTVLDDCFLNGTIKSLEINSANVEAWDDFNNVEREDYGEIVLSLGIYQRDNEEITYKEAIDNERSLILYITVKGVIRYGMAIDSISIMCYDDNYELYIANSFDKTAGRKIEFYHFDDYKKAMAYLYIATMKEKYIHSNNSIVSNAERKEDNTQRPYDKLNSLIGLDEIKADVNNLVNLMKMQIRRKQQGLKPVPVSLHLVFSGNPGTGKTTIARILADIYKEIGILSKGQLVEVDRAGLVAGYVGQTAIKTQEKIQEALGGILFIDEAYTLVKDGNDYGQEAIDTILKAMEDNRDDFIVIVAGYSDLMETFINSNPGLKSRFNKYINFPDYSADELIEIFYCMCNEYEYVLTDDAKEVLKEKIYLMEANKGDNFANARDVRNLFEEVITNQATRLANGLGSENIMEINEEDFM